MKTETKYCEKHRLEYYSFLNECPVCVGEKMKTPHLIEPEEKPKEEQGDKKAKTTKN